MSAISIIFESGKLAEVSVTLYKAPGDRSRLLDAYVTTECEGAVTRSARRAAEAVLGWLPEEYRPKEPMVAGFDLSGLSADQTMTGESGGLAFAIALVAELTGKAPGSLAATGILANSGAHSEVMPVKAIGAKLNGAIGALPSMSKIFFPEANRKDCSEEIKLVAERKGITLESVATLDQTLTLLFDLKRPGSAKPTVTKSRTFMAGIAAALVLLAILASIMSRRSESPSLPDEIVSKGSVNIEVREEVSPSVNQAEEPVTHQTDISEETTNEEPPPRVTPKTVPSGKGFD